MPPHTKKNTQKAAEIEGKIEIAISDLKTQRITSIRQAATIYQVPYTTLHHRLHGMPPKAISNTNKKKLTECEEETLIQWILSMDKRGFPVRPEFATEKANLLLSNRGPKLANERVGINWIRHFLKRHPEVKTRFSRRYDYKRAICEDPKIIRPWFDQVKRTIAEHGILDEDIYNVDETGFAMGLIATAKVITGAETRGRPFLIQPGQREWVTSIETISAAGWVLPPFIIFKGENKRLGWFENAIPGQRIDTSPNGWTTNDIGIDWLQNHFIPTTASLTKGVYRLLILDGHGSHLTAQFDEICAKNNVITLCMLAHSSQYLQPLDVACFGPLKRFYGRLIEKRSRLGYHHIDKFDFLTAFPKARQEAFKFETIKNAFAASGIVPYNPVRVLEKLNIQLKTPTPPPSRGSTSQSSWGLQTPHNTVQLQRQTSAINSLLKQMPPSPSNLTVRAVGQVIKGCELALNSAILLTKENQDLRTAIEQESHKRKRSTRMVKSTGSLTAEEAQRLIGSQNEALEGDPGPSTRSAAETSQPRKRAPPTCSNCHIMGHNRLQCPNNNLH
jgi:hypothetical protein